MNVSANESLVVSTLPGEQHASATLRVVDANQLPDTSGRSPNVATQFRRGLNGQLIETGSQIVPLPLHDARRDDGIGAVVWRGFKDGFGHPASFFSAAQAMRAAALDDRPFSAAQFQAAWARGSGYDDALEGGPVIGAALQVAQAITGLAEAAFGKSAATSWRPPIPNVLETGGVPGDTAGGTPAGGGRADRGV